jgi:hypothetical protein
MPGTPRGRPGPSRRVYAWIRSWFLLELEQLISALVAAALPAGLAPRSPPGWRGVRQGVSDERPPLADDARVEPKPRPAAATEPDAPELVGVLVDEAHSDVVMGGDVMRAPEALRAGLGRGGGRRKPHPELDREAIGDLVGKRRDRIVRSLKAVE